MWQGPGSPGGFRTASQHPNLEVFFIWLLTGGTWAAQNLPASTPVKKKQVDSDHWKESAAPTHSCQIIPTVPSVWGGLFFF